MQRRAHILGHIVSEYVRTAVPVGSQAIVRKYGLPVSPATVRNEMVKLEEEGYITHPHTSAGRVPSDKGYRYYVESLMEEEDLSWAEKQSIQRRLWMGQATIGRIDLMYEQARLAAAVLAEVAHNAALATPPRAPRCRLQRLELVALDGPRALLVLIFARAFVRQRVVELAAEASQEELTPVAARLSELFGGCTVDEVDAVAVDASTLEERVTDAVVAVMAEEEQSLYDEAFVDGVRNILTQPEFAQTDTVIELLGVLQEGSLLKVLPFDTLSGEGVTVVIGEENRDDAMRRCSVVITSYGLPGGSMGALAVLGPTRMEYSRVIPTVRYLSSLMSQLVAV